MTVRVEVVTPCSHGEFQSHPLGFESECRSQIHQAFTEWPPEAIEAAVTALTDYCDTHDVWNDADMAGVMLAAAWDHITGDNK